MRCEIELCPIFSSCSDRLAFRFAPCLAEEHFISFLGLSLLLLHDVRSDKTFHMGKRVGSPLFARGGGAGNAAVYCLLPVCGVPPGVNRGDQTRNDGLNLQQERFQLGKLRNLKDIKELHRLAGLWCQ